MSNHTKSMSNHTNAMSNQSNNNSTTTTTITSSIWLYHRHIRPSKTSFPDLQTIQGRPGLRPGLRPGMYRVFYCNQGLCDWSHPVMDTDMEIMEHLKTEHNIYLMSGLGAESLQSIKAECGVDGGSEISIKSEFGLDGESSHTIKSEPGMNGDTLHSISPESGLDMKIPITDGSDPPRGRQITKGNSQSRARRSKSNRRENSDQPLRRSYRNSKSPSSSSSPGFEESRKRKKPDS